MVWEMERRYYDSSFSECAAVWVPKHLAELTHFRYNKKYYIWEPFYITLDGLQDRLCQLFEYLKPDNLCETILKWFLRENSQRTAQATSGHVK